MEFASNVCRILLVRVKIWRESREKVSDQSGDFLFRRNRRGSALPARHLVGGSLHRTETELSIVSVPGVIIAGSALLMEELTVELDEFIEAFPSVLCGAALDCISTRNRW